MKYEITILTNIGCNPITCDDFCRRDNVLTLFKDGIAKPIAEFSMNTIHGYIVEEVKR